MHLPRVSVVIPNYNHARLLPRCLDALLNQSILPEEILVLDDASTDDSLEVLKAYARRSPILKVHRNERNLGVVPTMNRGLALAACDYVCFPAADDEVLPGLFEHALPLLAAHPRAGAVSGRSEWRCQTTGMRWYNGSRMPDEPCYLSPQEMIRLGRLGRLTMSGQHAIFRKTALLEAGGWVPELRWFTDFFGAWVVGFRHGLCHVPQVLSIFNLYPTSYYHTARSRIERRQTMDRLLRLLESDAYADVAPSIGKSGLLGVFGWPMLRVVASERTHWRFLNTAFLRHAGRRCAEVVGRRFFPPWLARACLRVFYRSR